MLKARCDGNSKNCRRYLEKDGSPKPEVLAGNPWLRLLASAERPFRNPERVESMEENGNGVLNYVMRTLDVLDEIAPPTHPRRKLLRTVLQWSETAKCGSEADRARWRSRGYPLEIHNEASASIYADFLPPEDAEGEAAEILIMTHGLLGQFIRGECALSDSAELLKVKDLLGNDAYVETLRMLNECVMRGVSEDLWKRTELEILDAVSALCADDFAPFEKTAEERLEALLPSESSFAKETVEFFEKRIFPKFSLWYFQSALEPFGAKGAEKIAAIAEKAVRESGADVRHLSFLPLSEEIHYDHDGRRSVNVYKQRIIEKYLSDPKEFGEHVRPEVEIRDSFALVSFRFAPACAKLTEFCAEAERSGLLTYERSVAMIYDLFGFRRDGFDRLANEEKYLETMNSSALGSGKLRILDWVKGESVVDVGSGGGILLRGMEERFPNMKVTGTDVSENVIEALNRAKKEEGRNWEVIRHDLTEGPLPEKTDCVVFSSILHEILSYSETDGRRYNPESVRRALANAAASLNRGGRIIIRDGVGTPGRGRMRIRFKTDDGMRFFMRFAQDFRGMDEIPESGRIFEIDSDSNAVVADYDYAREFLYTYTWGPESYPHEVKERFGFFSLEALTKELESLGMRILKAESVFEKGYEENLSPLVRLEDPETGKETGFPPSNCFVVAESSGGED